MKYLDVIANANLLQKALDLTNVLIEMANEKFVMTKAYMRGHILKLWRLTLDMDDTPESLQPGLVPVTEKEPTK